MDAAIIERARRRHAKREANRARHDGWSHCEVICGTSHGPHRCENWATCRVTMADGSKRLLCTAHAHNTKKERLVFTEAEAWAVYRARHNRLEIDPPERTASEERGA